MRFIEPFTPEQQTQIRRSVLRNGPEGALAVLDSEQPSSDDVQMVITCLGDDVDVRPDTGEPAPDADAIIGIIEAVTEHWT